jgi:hypothetical protein
MTNEIVLVSATLDELDIMFKESGCNKITGNIEA